jgi:hypothetical protein
MPIAARRPATCEDVLAAPDHVVAEIVDGDLVTSPPPGSPHAYAAGKVFRDIDTRFDGPTGSDGGGHAMGFRPRWR